MSANFADTEFTSHANLFALQIIAIGTDMTPEIDELERLARAAKEATEKYMGEKVPEFWPDAAAVARPAIEAFRAAANPQAILSLCAELKEARGNGWRPISELTKEHLPALIKGGTYDWSDSWNNEFIPYTGVTLAFYMPDKWHEGAMRGDQHEGHDNYFWHKPEWFFSIAQLGEPRALSAKAGEG